MRRRSSSPPWPIAALPDRAGESARGRGAPAGGEVVRVDLHVLLPLVGELVLGEAGVHGARLDARVAVDALLGVDVEHLGRVVSGLVWRRVDAVDGADLDTGVVLGADARLSDYVGHSLLSPARFRGALCERGILYE